MQHKQWIGKILDGKYHIEAFLGEGGFGEVYLARQLSTRKRVAVKMMRPALLEMDDVEQRAMLVERFRRELHLVAELDHPHIVSILDAGGAAYPNAPAPLYAVFSYIEGSPLGTVLQTEGCLSVYETRRLLFQAAEALAHAHEAGITHRDIKPDNLMVSGRMLEYRNVHVLDFGIAGIKREAEVQQQPQHSATVTRTGDLLGTPAYMAPEQINDLRNTTPAADLYAWALVYVESLTGQRVVTASNAFSAYSFHTSADPVPLAAEIRNLPDVSWLAWCLQKDPLMRPQNATELLIYINEALRRETPQSIAHLQHRRVGEVRARPSGGGRLGAAARLALRVAVIVWSAVRRGGTALVRSLYRDFKTLLTLILAFSGVGFLWLWRAAPAVEPAVPPLPAIGELIVAAPPDADADTTEPAHPAPPQLLISADYPTNARYIEELLASEAVMEGLRTACESSTAAQSGEACKVLWVLWGEHDPVAARAWFAARPALGWTPPSQD
jgi:tRNA A-37 threonylcarbamoyl transferase component Bud32